MARTNIRFQNRLTTHEGAPARPTNVQDALRRSVMANMLWENTFYEEGVEIGNRIEQLVQTADPQFVRDLAIEARTQMKLRHVPLLLCRELARRGELEARTLDNVIQRPDEITEFLSLYWNGKRSPLAGQVKKGLARAFGKFSEYQLAKYNRDDAIKLRDALFLCHAKAKDAEQDHLWKRLIGGYCEKCWKSGKDHGKPRHKFAEARLQAPDTWEVALSGGADKREAFTRLLSENKLGALALLRNLRNMLEAKVDMNLIREGLRSMKTEWVLPFRFIAAARYAPMLEPELEQAMFKCLAGAEKIPGETVLLVDRSGSMSSPIGGKSEMARCDAAAALAMLAREICEHVRVFQFDDRWDEVANRRGFALLDAIGQPRGGTYLGAAIQAAMRTVDPRTARLIVFTDEQSHDSIPMPIGDNRWYMINVAAYQNGIGYKPWVHIDGFSENVFQYILELEKSDLD